MSGPAAPPDGEESAASGPCPDCRTSFPYLKAGSKCGKCELLNGLSRNSDEYAKIMAYPVCAVCGDSYPNMPLCDAPQTCPRDGCLKLVGRYSENAINLGFMVAQPKEVGPAGQAPQTFNDRTEAVTQRLKLSRPGGNVPAGSDISSEHMRNLEEKGNKSSAKKGSASVDVGTLPVQWSYVRHKTGKVDRSLGKGSHLFHPYDTVTTVLEHIRKHARHDLWPEVNRTELSLQLNGGYSLDPGTVSMRLDEFMQYYSKKPDAFTKFLLPPARTRGAPNTNTPKDIMLELHLQVYIHDDLYESRMEDSTPTTGIPLESKSKNGGGKGKGQKSTANSGRNVPPSASQIPRGSGSVAFRSYRPGSRRPDITASTELDFMKIVPVIDTETGDAMLRVIKQPLTGHLSDTHFAYGEMKLTYRLIANGVGGGHPTFYAAKRLYRMEGSENTSDAPVTSFLDGFTVKEQNEAMQKECLRSGLTIHLLEEFYNRVDELGATGSIFKYLQVAECFLALEKGVLPSPASGIAFFEDGDEFSRSIMWAVEPYRSTSTTVMQRFSGTLRHTTPNADSLSMTIYALVHFIYWYTEGEIVLADVQGTPGRVADNDGFILFDMMTHTQDGTSGIGDFGKKGIKTFLRDHKCKDICRKLQLPEISLCANTSIANGTPSPERRRSTRILAKPKVKAQEDEEGEAKEVGGSGEVIELDED